MHRGEGERERGEGQNEREGRKGREEVRAGGSERKRGDRRVNEDGYTYMVYVCSPFSQKFPQVFVSLQQQKRLTRISAVLCLPGESNCCGIASLVKTRSIFYAYTQSFVLEQLYRCVWRYILFSNLFSFSFVFLLRFQTPHPFLWTTGSITASICRTATTSLGHLPLKLVHALYHERHVNTRLAQSSPLTELLELN